MSSDDLSVSFRFRITGLVILTYLFVSVLHGLWDGLPYALYIIAPPGIPISLTTAAISIIGLGTLFVLYRRAINRQVQQIQQAQAAVPTFPWPPGNERV